MTPTSMLSGASVQSTKDIIELRFMEVLKFSANDFIMPDKTPIKAASFQLNQINFAGNLFYKLHRQENKDNLNLINP